MLASFRRHLAFHRQAALVSLRALYRKPVSSLVTILVMAITLVLPAVFWILSDNMAHLASHWKREGHITLYLKLSLSSHDIDAFFTQVKQMPEVAQASLKSSEEALVQLQQQEGMQDVMHYLPENPLPASIEVIPASNMTSPDKLEQFFHQLEHYQQVEQATLDLQWLRRLYALVNFINSIAHGVMILLGLAIIFIISNISRLAIYHRYDEIRVLKLIGAKDGFISRPFLYTGIWYGLASAVVAVMIVYAFMVSLTAVTQQMANAYEVSDLLVGLSLEQILFITLASVTLGWLGAYFSVWAYIVQQES